MSEPRLFEIKDPNMVRIIEEVDKTKVTKPIIVDNRPGRNDPCPCGSGKKFKYCHGKD